MADLEEGHKTMARGAFWGLAGNIALKLVSLVYTIVLARFFTQSDVGLFYLALSIISVISIFGDLGLNSAFSRYVPFYIGRGEKEKAYNLLRAAYLFSGALSLLFSCAIFIFANQIASSLANPLVAQPLQFLSCFILINSFFNLNSSFLIGLKKIKDSNLLYNGQNVLKLLLTVALFLFVGSNSFVIAFSFTASYLVFAIVSFWYINKEIRANKIAGEKFGLGGQIELLKETVPLGITIGLIVGIATLASYIDRIMLGYLMPPETAAAQIGVYSIAIAVALLIVPISGSVLGIFSPMAAERYGKGDMGEMEKISKTAVRWNVFLLAPFSILMVVFPGEILQMFYGSAYVGGAMALAIFAAGTALRILTSIEGAILSSMRVIKAELYAAAITLSLNIVLNVLLIPPYGIAGAALASAISLLAASALIWYYCRKITGFSFIREAVKPVIAGILTLVALFLLRGIVLAGMDSVPPFSSLGEGLAALIAQKIVKLVILGLIFCLICIVYLIFLLLIRAIRREDTSLVFAGLRKGGVPAPFLLKLEAFAARLVPEDPHKE